MNFRALPFILAIGLLFGMSVVASRFAVGQFEPLTYVGLRITLAALTFVAVYLFARRQYPFPTDLNLWRHALVLGIASTAIPMTTFVAALQYQSSGVTSIMVTVGPAIVVLLAHFVLDDEHLTPLKGMGILLALTGALLLALRGETGLADVTQANPMGYILVSISLLSYSASSIYARKYVRAYRAFDITAAQTIIAMIVVMLLASVTVGFDFSRVNGLGIGVLIYAGLGATFGAFLLYFITLKRFGATTAAMSNYIVPIAATTGGIVLLGETVTGGMALGMVLIMAGIALVNVQMASKTVAKKAVADPV